MDRGGGKRVEGVGGLERQLENKFAYNIAKFSNLCKVPGCAEKYKSGSLIFLLI